MAYKEPDEWQPHGSEYHRLSAGMANKSNTRLLTIIKKGLSSSDIKKPQYRQWRRLAVREALKRGLITKDPGGANCE